MSLNPLPWCPPFSWSIHCGICRCLWFFFSNTIFSIWAFQLSFNQIMSHRFETQLWHLTKIQIKWEWSVPAFPYHWQVATRTKGEYFFLWRMLRQIYAHSYTMKIEQTTKELYPTKLDWLHGSDSTGLSYKLRYKNYKDSLMYLKIQIHSKFHLMIQTNS